MNKLSQAPTVWRASDTRIYPPRPYPSSAFVERTDTPGARVTGVPPEVPTTRKRRMVALVVVGILLASILLAGAGFFAYRALFGGGGGSAIIAACKSETSALREAEGSYKDMTQQYGDLPELQVAGFAKETPAYHQVVRLTGKKYIVRVTDARCGVPGNEVGQTPADH